MRAPLYKTVHTTHQIVCNNVTPQHTHTHRTANDTKHHTASCHFVTRAGTKNRPATVSGPLVSHHQSPLRGTDLLTLEHCAANSSSVRKMPLHSRKGVRVMARLSSMSKHTAAIDVPSRDLGPESLTYLRWRFANRSARWTLSKFHALPGSHMACNVSRAGLTSGFVVSDKRLDNHTLKALDLFMPV